MRVFLWIAAAGLLLVGVAFLIIRLTAGVISWLWGIGAPVVVIGLFLWLYFCLLILMIGAEFNVFLMEWRKRRREKREKKQGS